MNGDKNGDYFSKNSAGMVDIEPNLLVQSKHYDVKEQRFSAVLGKSSSNDSSYE